MRKIREIKSRAEALRICAAQAKRGLEIQNQIAENRLRAERCIGKHLKETDKNTGHGELTKKVGLHDATPLPTLKDLGIKKTQFHRWQAAASLPDKEFEKYIAEAKASNEELSTIGVIRLARRLNTHVKQNTGNQQLQERRKQTGDLKT